MARDVFQIEHEPLGPPVAKSLLLHLVLAGALAVLLYFNAHYRGAEWGTKGPVGAIQATLVTSSASIPLPQTAPPTPNVLATQLPSPAPAPPSKATIQQVQQNAIPILARQPKLRPKEQRHVYSPKHAQPLNQPHRARYGEAAPTQLAHAMTNAPAVNTNPVNITNGEFAALFPWYVALIQRTVQQYWYTSEVASSTPYGSQVVVYFTIHHDGTVSDIRIEQPSSSPTLNASAMQAVERVGSFQPLPSQYTGSTLSVGYTFSNPSPSK
ncbi:MAG TPA: TonB family protein [Acidobacteriaceae bacterium]|nr:TonB family protein [Acidobacteriaceae bacterium]